MAFKIAFIGAGSIGFTRRLLADILTVPEFENIEIAFHDIDRKNLERVARLCRRDLEHNGARARLTTSLDRREALRGARYVFCTVRIGGLEAFRSDIEIPLRYGIDQCVGDTLCAGGIFYAQRGIPPMLEFCRDIAEVAEPGARLFNYANPMAMLTWAASHHTGVPTIGLCHGVQAGHKQIAQAFGLEKKEVDIVAAGINHQTWYIQIRHRGKDLVPKLLSAMEKHPEFRETEKVRIDMLRRFGYFSTESNGHLSEYVPWYRKRLKEIPRWIDPRRWILGETGGYLRVCLERRNWFDTEFPEWMKEPPYEFTPESRSVEHGSYILEGLETGRPYRGHFNVVNHDCIPNLPADSVVEVPSYVDRNGIQIPRVGDLPPGCAAVCQNSIAVQRLAVEAALSGDDNLLRQAVLLDPLCGAVCNPPEIWDLVDEMLVAQAKWLPQYKKAIASARRRGKAAAAAPKKKTRRARKSA